MDDGWMKEGIFVAAALCRVYERAHQQETVERQLIHGNRGEKIAAGILPVFPFSTQTTPTDG